MKRILLLLAPLALLMHACQEQQKYTVDYDRRIPEIITSYPLPSRTFYNELLASGQYPEGGTYRELGFYLSATPFSDGPGTRFVTTMVASSTFSAWIDGLEPGNSYYLRAFGVNNSGGEILGNIIRVTTPETKIGYVILGTPETDPASINSRTELVYNRVTSYGLNPETGEIDDNDGVIEYGASYWPSSDDEASAKKVTVKTTLKTDIALNSDFETTLPDLVPSTLYSYRVYARNNRKEQFSEVRSFITADAEPPAVATNATIFDGTTVVVASGSLTDTGNDPDCEYGFYIGTTEQNMKERRILAANLGESLTDPTLFTALIQGLQKQTSYYVAAFAKNFAGESVGNAMPIATTDNTKPVLNTRFYDYDKVENYLAVDRVTALAEIFSDGGMEITRCGAKWGASPDALDNDTPGSVVPTETTSSIEVPITGLSSGQLIYYVIYAENSLGRTYLPTVESVCAKTETAAYYNNHTQAGGNGAILDNSSLTNKYIGLSATDKDNYYELPPITITEGARTYRYYFLDRNLGATQVFPANNPTVRSNVFMTGYRFVWSFKVPSSIPATGSGNQAAYGWTQPTGYLMASPGNWNWNTGTVGTPPANPSPAPANYAIPTRAEWQAYVDWLPASMRNLTGVQKTIRLGASGFKGQTGITPNTAGATPTENLMIVFAADRVTNAAGNPPTFQARDRDSDADYTGSAYYSISVQGSGTPIYAANVYGGIAVRCFRKMEITTYTPPEP